MSQSESNENRETRAAPGRMVGAIWALMAGQRTRYVGAIVSLAIASLLLYVAPLVVQATLDGVILAGGDPPAASRFVLRVIGGADFVAGNLWWPALLVFVVTVGAGFFTYGRARLAAQASESIARSVRDRTYDHLQRLPCRYFDEASTGDLVQRCTADVETLRVFLATQVVEIGRAIIMLLMPLPIMLAIDVRMTLMSVALIGPVVAFSLVYFKRVRKAFLQTDEADGRMTATIQENLTGIRVVRAFARQEHEAEKFGARNREHRDLDQRVYELAARFWSLSDLLCFLQKGLVIGAGAFWLANGTLGVGAYYYFLTAVAMFIWPVRMMGRILTDLGKATVSLGRLLEILETPEETAADTPPSVSVAPRARGAIDFEGVDFRYGNGPLALRGFDVTVPAGTTLALVGPSGSGKSTMIGLLLRFYDPTAGTVRMDGHDLRDLDRRELRTQLAVVMQEPFLYSRTLRENLVIAAADGGDEALYGATTVAAVHESIERFDHGYDTRVGERGVTLSGGQRQRVALARALLQDPAVLVLDDSLSAVDTGTETAILDALRDRAGRCTTIIIAHRLSAVTHADRILVLADGAIVEDGAHAELLGLRGAYHRWWEAQRSIGDAAGSGMEVSS